MFGLFKKDPTKKMRAEYNKLLEQGMHAQRNGDIRLYADITAKAEALWREIEKIEKPD